MMNAVWIIALLVIVPIVGMVTVGIIFYLAAYGLKAKIGVMVSAWRTPAIENPIRRDLETDTRGNTCNPVTDSDTRGDTCKPFGSYNAAG